MSKPMNREPVITVGTITGVVTALIALFVAFGLDLNRDQQTAILGIVAAVAPLVAAIIARQRVTPVAGQRTRNEGGFIRIEGGDLDRLEAAFAERERTAATTAEQATMAAYRNRRHTS